MKKCWFIIFLLLIIPVDCFALDTSSFLNISGVMITLATFNIIIAIILFISFITGLFFTIKDKDNYFNIRKLMKIKKPRGRKRKKKSKSKSKKRKTTTKRKPRKKGFLHSPNDCEVLGVSDNNDQL